MKAQRVINEILDRSNVVLPNATTTERVDQFKCVEPLIAMYRDLIAPLVID